MDFKSALFVLAAAMVGIFPPLSKANATAEVSSFLNEVAQDIEIEADLDSLFAQTRNGECEGELGSKPTVTGQVKMKVNGAWIQLPATISVRGNSSVHDCAFPKLSLEFKAADVAATPLAGRGKLRLNTHCADPRLGHTELGRVAGNDGPMREGLVYDWARALGLMTFESKLLNVTYKLNGYVVQQMALALESKKAMSARIGSPVLEEEDLEDEVNLLEDLSVKARNVETLKSLLFQALIGNYDFSLQITDLLGERHAHRVSPPSSLWNMLISVKNGEYRIGPTDFDVASLVTQMDYEPDTFEKKISEHQFALVQKWRAFFNQKTFQEAADFFETMHPNLVAAVDKAKLRDEEKKVFLAHIEGFLNALRQRHAPVLKQRTRVYFDPDLKKECGAEDPDGRVEMMTPIGLPVFVLERRASAIKVMILDVRDGSMFNPMTDRSCVDGPVWIPAATQIDSDF